MDDSALIEFAQSQNQPPTQGRGRSFSETMSDREDLFRPPPKQKQPELTIEQAKTLIKASTSAPHLPSLMRSAKGFFIDGTEVDVDSAEGGNGGNEGDKSEQDSNPEIEETTVERSRSNLRRVESLPNQVILKELGPEDFKFVKLIGKGDVGRVYLVNKKGTKKLYAMKVLSKEEMLKRNKVRRVLTEQELLKTAKHPFIMTLYYTFQSKNFLYFVMEYCGGGEFFRTLQRQPNKRISETAAKHYIAEVVLALEYVHMLGFVYRDLKPENILLHSSGHIMLTDFDLCKRANDAKLPSVIMSNGSFGKPKIRGIDTASSLGEMRTNSFVGTEEYIAPEVIRGNGHSFSVDWWTVGVLLYEMVYGFTPFKGDDRKATFKNILEREVGFPEYPNVSNACKNFIRKLLVKTEKKRLGSLHGAADVKKDTFFNNIHWALLRHSTPPIIPKVNHPLDTSNFRNIADDLQAKGYRIDQEQGLSTDLMSPQDPFKSFTSESINNPDSVQDGAEG